MHSFETRTGPAGWPGTRAWDRSRSKQKPAWELAGRNPAYPSNPGWDPTYFFFICIEVKRRKWTMHWCRKDQLPSMSLLFFLLFLLLHVQTASNPPFLLIQAASLFFFQWLVVRYFLVCSQPFLTQRLVSVIKKICHFF